MAHTNILLAAALHAFSSRLPPAAVEQSQTRNPPSPRSPPQLSGRTAAHGPAQATVPPAPGCAGGSRAKEEKVSSRSSLAGHRPQQVAGRAALSPGPVPS